MLMLSFEDFNFESCMAKGKSEICPLTLGFRVLLGQSIRPVRPGRASPQGAAAYQEETEKAWSSGKADRSG